MAESYTNPEVRFERTDIAPSPVLTFGIALGGLTAFSLVAMLLFGLWLYGVDERAKKTDLPAASVDGELPPEPRLEALEDLKKKRPQLFPDRASESLEPQQRLLDQGDAKKGIIPIDEAMRDLAGKLPVAKKRDTGGGK